MAETGRKRSTPLSKSLRSILGGALAGPTVAGIPARLPGIILMSFDGSENQYGPEIIYIGQCRAGADQRADLVEQAVAVMGFQMIAQV